MSNATADSPAAELFAEWHGEIVPLSFNSGFVAVSFVVSLIGAATTLELIHRRTAPQGLLNHLRLIGAAITMGGVAIWAMHFIGNQAITIGDGQPQLQIEYASGVTVLSFFISVLVLGVAFIAIGTSASNRLSWGRVTTGGVLAGTAICCMHYIGNASISNYSCEYRIVEVVGSAIITVVASTVALTLVFVFQAAWTSAWWKRVGSALLLATAASGMHWCASLGTSYRLITLRANSGRLSKKTTVFVALCLAIIASCVLAVLSIYTAFDMKRYANRAQKVVLAAAVFDRHSRVLVSPAGLLPSQKITDSFVEKRPQDSLTVAHPLFHWMFQVSRDWQSVSWLIDGMANHLSQLSRASSNTAGGGAWSGSSRGGGGGGGSSSRGGGTVSLVDSYGEPIENYDAVVRELFCIAADNLALQLKTTLEQVGILWEEILVTGTASEGFIGRKPRWEREGCPAGQHEEDEDVAVDATSTRMSWPLTCRRSHKPEPTSDDRAEKGLRFGTGKTGRTGRNGSGSLLFIVRRLDSDVEVQALEAAGFRFAELHQVSASISSSMQTSIGSRGLEAKLREMAGYAVHKPALLEPGVHLGLFGVRARAGPACGTDVLVRKGARNLLLSVPLALEPPGRLERWHIDFVQQVDRMSIGAILHVLDAAVPDAQEPKPELKAGTSEVGEAAAIATMTAATTATTTTATTTTAATPTTTGVAVALAETTTFVRQLASSIRALLDSVGDAALAEATAASKVVNVPCSPDPLTGARRTATMIAMRVIIPASHPQATNNGNDNCEFVPLGLFRAYQVAHGDSPHRAAFSRSVVREMAPLIIEAAVGTQEMQPRRPRPSTYIAELAATRPSWLPSRVHAAFARLVGLHGRPGRQGLHGARISSRRSPGSTSAVNLKSPWDKEVDANADLDAQLERIAAAAWPQNHIRSRPSFDLGQAGRCTLRDSGQSETRPIFLDPDTESEDDEAQPGGDDRPASPFSGAPLSPESTADSCPRGRVEGIGGHLNVFVDELVKRRFY